jgi:phosphoribosylamine--glycine ligase
MNWLVLGSGGREHAIAWKLAQSELVSAVFVLPGNPGMRVDSLGKVIPVGNQDNIIGFCRANDCDRVIVGPENLLAEGIADELAHAGIKVLGPSQSAARLEASKSFARAIIDRASAPGPDYRILGSIAELHALIADWPWDKGMVVKADGLAAGKGVFVCCTPEKAQSAILSLKLMDQKSDGRLLANGLVCEELIPGREVSVFALCDGKDFVWFGSACDHKRLLDGDEGPNTGGMGAYAPAPWLDGGLQKVICDRIFRPVLKVMSDSGSPFRGFLFAGLMINDSGPRILEFNVRLGDPETQSILPLLDEDFARLVEAAMGGELAARFPSGVRWRESSAVHIVKAAKGYPGIDGTTVDVGARIEWKENLSDQRIFFAGVASDPTDSEALVTAGGRVLGITATGASIAEASQSAYEGLAAVHFFGEHWRRDIGR